jgi:hypothetical protein
MQYRISNEEADQKLTRLPSAAADRPASSARTRYSFPAERGFGPNFTADRARSFSESSWSDALRKDIRAARASPMARAAWRWETTLPGLPPLLPVEQEEVGTTHERPVGERLDDELTGARPGV